MFLSALKRKKVTRIFSFLLLSVLVITSFSSCAPNNTKTVGSVGEYDVPYEEFYFLAFSYKESLEAKYGEYEKLDDAKAKQFEDELRNLVYSNIVTNYAILSLCKEEGLTLEGDDLEDRVDQYVENMITTSFGSSKSKYKDSLKQFGLTDHYIRFTASVDMLYSDLMTKILSESDVANSDQRMREIIKNEFARTWHIMITNDKGESVEENLAKAEEALQKYRDGSMSMYNLIGSVYNEDLSITDLDGFYFARGSMDEVYEEVAFSLEVGEVSDVIETFGTNSVGETVRAFYIIQRLEIEDTYIENNLYDLKQKYINSVIYEMLIEEKSKLEFEPNEFAKGLDIISLEAPTSSGVIIVVVGGAVALIIAASLVYLLVVKKRRSRAPVKRKK